MRSVATCVNSCLLGYTVWIIKDRLWDLCQKRIIDSDKKDGGVHFTRMHCGWRSLPKAN